jgi:hypothetical protein
MFLSELKKTLDVTRVIHRFIYENTDFFEDVSKIDQKKYNDLQIGVFKKIAELKFGGDINKFIKDPIGMKTMQTYREYVKEHLTFLLASDNNPQFNTHDPVNVDGAVKFILNKLYPQAAAFSAKG